MVTAYVDTKDDAPDTKPDESIVGGDGSWHGIKYVSKGMRRRQWMGRPVGSEMHMIVANMMSMSSLPSENRR